MQKHHKDIFHEIFFRGGLSLIIIQNPHYNNNIMTFILICTTKLPVVRYNGVKNPIKKTHNPDMNFCSSIEWRPCLLGSLLFLWDLLFLFLLYFVSLLILARWVLNWSITVPEVTFLPQFLVHNSLFWSSVNSSNLVYHLLINLRMWPINF